MGDKAFPISIPLMPTKCHDYYSLGFCSPDEPKKTTKSHIESQLTKNNVRNKLKTKKKTQPNMFIFENVICYTSCIRITLYS